MDDTSRSEILELLGESLRTLPELDHALDALMRSCGKAGTADPSEALAAVGETFRVGLLARSLVREAIDGLRHLQEAITRERERADTVRPPEET